MSLQDKTVNSIIWSGIERFSTLFIQFVCTIFIARVLTPSDFGLIGMLTIFVSIAQTIVDSGFGQALVRKQTISTIDYSSVFYVNLALGVILYIILYLCSDYIALFYNMPDLARISKIIFLVIPINALSLIQYTIFQRNINFKILSKITIYSSILSGGIGILAAFKLQNVWALVIQNILLYFFRTLFLWIRTDWYPQLKFSFSSIKEMFTFSINLLFAGLISNIFNNIYSLVIGKFYTPTDLGYYSQADRIQKIPSTSITEVIQRVTFPILSTIQDDKQRLKDSYRKIINMTLFIIAPLMLFLAAIASDLFDLFLTEKWKIASHYFKILCFTGICYPLSCINLNILIVRGKSKIIFYLECMKKIILLIILCITINFSMTVVIYGQLLYSFIAVGLNLYLCGKEIQLNIKRQLLDIIPIISAAFIMYLCISIFHYWINSSLLVFNIILSFVIAVISYFSISYILRIKSLYEIKSIILNKFIK